VPEGTESHKERTAAVHFVTLGCPKNEVDSDRMRAVVASSAFTLAEDGEAADVVVVNTCSFIREATEESIRTVLELAGEWKDGRGDRKLVVAGCMPSRYGEELTASLPEVDAFLPVADEGELLRLLHDLTGVDPRATDGPARTVTSGSAYLQVSDGCFRRCAYCTIPYIRGPYRSRSLDDILGEARLLVAGGAREIVLVGQDISALGRETGGEKLAEVVRALGRLDGLDWLRLMYVQPDGVTDELLEAMAAAPNVCRYLDLPLQHASRDVLRRMNRLGDAESVLALIERVRAAIPDIVLRTSLIAGFPGETRRDVEELQRFLEAARFDYAGIFTYSQEDGTTAAQMPDQVPLRTRRARAQRIRDLADAIGFERAARHVGATLDVLVEGAEDGETVGRWRGQAPEVDGMVLLGEKEFVAGTIVQARIVDSMCYDLIGEVA